MRHAKIVTPWTGTGTINDPYFPNIPDVDHWQDVTGQPVSHLIESLDPYTIEVWASDAQMAAIQADPSYVVVWDIDADAEDQTPPDLDESGLDDLKVEIQNIYYRDIAEFVTQDTFSPPVISTNLVDVQIRQPWLSGLQVQVGEIYQYNGNLYEVIQSHTTQSDWTPDNVPALFKRYYEPGDDPWPWVQPQGAHDAYPLGARVAHNGSTWQSLIDANVWEPGAVGSESLWENLTPPPPTSEWQPNTSYTIGEQVTYGGNLYECRQSHTSQIGWEPPNVPALWLLV